MKLLAIETSATACSVALLLDNEIKFQHIDAPMQQAQCILSMIDNLLAAAQVPLSELTALAWGSGPGSFTGIRVAASVVQGLGFALNLPIIQVSSLAALAQTAYDALGWEHLLVAVDARIQEVYWATYSVNRQGYVELVGSEIVSTPEKIHVPEQQEWMGVGNAFAVYSQHLPILTKIDSTILPTAQAVAKLAKVKLLEGDILNVNQVSPTYLRDHIAKKQQSE